jgi:predicted PurR-regulated permease PerM
MSGEPARPDQPRPDPLLDTGVRKLAAGVDAEHPFGRPGTPLGERSPFRLALLASIGAGLAYELARAVISVREVLLLGAVALVIAVGLERPVGALSRHMRRGFAVPAVLVAFFALFAGFLAAALPPLTTQATALVHVAPSYLLRLQEHSATLRHLDARYHLVTDLRRRVAEGPGLGLTAFGGVVGVGKALLSAGAALIIVIVLLVYFVANLPAMKRSAYRMLPRSRRARAGLVSDEVLARVGGYIVGNLATSVLAGLAALFFLLATGVPYPVALALFVAITDLVPLLGATVGALVVCVVAFFVSVPVGIASACFFVAYQLLEHRLVVPRLVPAGMRLSPLPILLAAVVGGVLFGGLGVIVAIPLMAGVRVLLTEVVFPRQDAH